MIPALVVFGYLAIVLGIGLFGGRGCGADAEDYFLAGRTIGPVVFLLSSRPAPAILIRYNV